MSDYNIVRVSSWADCLNKIETDTSNNTSSNLINVVRGIKAYTGEKPEDFSDWYRKAGFILSMQRPDTFVVMEG